MGAYSTAVEYVGQGYSVIAIRPGEKRPVATWKPYTERLPTTTELQAYLSSTQNNIAIVTGPISKLVVIDIDNPDLYTDFYQRYPTGRVAKTPSGGFHLLYHYEGSDIGNSVEKLKSGIDVRGNHGYIVAAPSRIKLAGGGVGIYQWLLTGTPSPLPEKLRAEILAEMPNVTSNAGDDGHALIQRLLSQGFTPGHHNVEMRDAARYLARMGTDARAITNILTVLNNKDTSPLPASELAATISSSVRYEQGRKTAAPETQAKKFTAQSFIDVAVKQEGRDSNWLIQDWLPENSVMVVTAPPENYKTWLALEAAVAVALGQGAKFLNAYEASRQPKPVLIVQQEDNISKTAARLRTIIYSLSQDIKYGFYKQKEPDGSTTYSFGTPWNAPIYLHTDSSLSFDDDASIAGLEAFIKEHGIKLVVIDPLYSMGAADDYFAALARKMILIKQLRDKYDVAFLFVHHNKKGTKNAKVSDSKERETMWGSQLLNGAFEGFWLINVADGQRVVHRVGKAYDGVQETFAIEFLIDTGAIQLSAEGDVLSSPHYLTKLAVPTTGQLSDTELDVLNAINMLGHGTHADIVQQSGTAKAAVTRALKTLLALGSIEVTEGSATSRSKEYQATASN